MKLLSFVLNGRETWGAVVGDGVVDLGRRIPECATLADYIGSGRYLQTQETTENAAFLNSWNNSRGPDATVHARMSSTECLACHSSGAGIVGASLAYHLSGRGAQVTLIEAGEIAGEDAVERQAETAGDQLHARRAHRVGTDELAHRDHGARGPGHAGRGAAADGARHGRASRNAAPRQSPRRGRLGAADAGATGAG